MKTLEISKITKSHKNLEDWEMLCDACASIAEKARWTEKDSDRLIKRVRKEIREQ